MGGNTRQTRVSLNCSLLFAESHCEKSVDALVSTSVEVNARRRGSAVRSGRRASVAVLAGVGLRLGGGEKSFFRPGLDKLKDTDGLKA